MSAGQPSEHLARIKREHPLYSIRHVTEGYGFTAHRPEHPNLWALTLPDLERMLRDAEHPRGPQHR